MSLNRTAVSSRGEGGCWQIKMKHQMTEVRRSKGGADVVRGGREEHETLPNRRPLLTSLCVRNRAPVVQSAIYSWLTPVWWSCPLAKNESTLDPFVPVLRTKAGPHSCLCVTMFNNRAIPYCRLPRPARRSGLGFKQRPSTNLQPLVIFSFFITSSCLFKAALLCNDAAGSRSSSSCSPHAVNTVFTYAGALNRDRKGLKAGRSAAAVCRGLRSPGSVLESSAFWSRTQGPMRVEEEKKEGWSINLLEAWSTHGLHHCFFLVLAFARCAPKISQIQQCKI